MFQAFTITSGNGSGGMTPLTVNLGISLALLERETCILDADIGMADMALFLGMGASRTFKRIAARRSGVGYKEEAGDPAQENFVGRLARAGFI
jgi:MinD-like ATPase involved in chromosome partitioning or flagellar assembly